LTSENFLIAEIGGEMVHTSDGSLHFQEEWCVVALMLLQLSAGVGDNAVLTIRVDLGDDSHESPGLFVITQAGVDNEGVGPVAVQVEAWSRDNFVV
jgi:hypothetical protein